MGKRYWPLVAFACIQMLVCLSPPALAASGPFDRSEVPILATSEPDFEDTVDRAFGAGTSSRAAGQLEEADGQLQQTFGEGAGDQIEGQAKAIDGRLQQAAGEAEATSEEMVEAADEATRTGRERAEDAGSQFGRAAEDLVEGVKTLFGNE